MIGWITFPLIVCQFFYQKKYVANIVTRHLSEGEEKNVEEERDGMCAANKGKEDQEIKEDDGGQDEENESQEEDERKEKRQEMNKEKGAKEDIEEEVKGEKH